MSIEIFKETDYPTLYSWWTDHGWSPVPFNMLPKTGFVVDNICAGFIYITDSQLCHMEWIISDPNSDKEKRDVALNTLIDTLCMVAKEYNCKAVFTTAKQKVLIERLKHHGFTTTDTEMVHLIKRID